MGRNQLRKNKDDCFTTNYGFGHYDFSGDGSVIYLEPLYCQDAGTCICIKSGDPLPVLLGVSFNVFEHLRLQLEKVM